MSEARFIYLSQEDAVRCGAADVAATVADTERTTQLAHEGKAVEAPTATLFWDVPAEKLKNFVGYPGKKRANIHAGVIYDDVRKVGLKNIPSNPDNPLNGHGPRASGLLTMLDPETGYPIALMDAMVISCMRTGALGAIGVRHLRAPGARTLGLIGVGPINQAALACTAHVMPELQTAFVYDLDPKRAQAFAEAHSRKLGVANTQLDIIRPAEYRTLHLNRRAGPLADRRVREAIVRALNVPQIAQFVGNDVAIPGRSVVPLGYLGETGEGWDYPFDLARARALLAEAGHANGFTLRAVVSSISTQQPIMEVVQAQLRRIGIDLEMSVVDHATYHSQIRRDLSAVVFYGAARFPVAASYLGEFYHSRAQIGSPTAALNFSHCDAADAEIDAAAAAREEASRLAHWRNAQRQIHEQICAIPLFDLMQVWVRSSRVDLGYELRGGMNLAPALTEATRLR